MTKLTTTAIRSDETVPKTTTERVPFRLIQMECCGALICHVNHRLPSYCSNCGASVYPQVRGWVAVFDPDAVFIYDAAKLP